MGRKKTICLDFDGTIAQYEGWAVNGRLNLGDPIKGAKEFVEELKALGYNIIIHTCRCSPHSAPEAKQQEDPNAWLTGIVKNWLLKHAIPFDEVWIGEGKPHGDFYIDDRAIRVNHKENPEAFRTALDIIHLVEKQKEIK